MPYAFNKGVRLYWEEEGAGLPLLMIMGLSFSLAMWGGLRQQMARRFRAILFDNRCVGRSELPRRPFSIRAMADDAVAILDAAGVQQAHVLGFSMGGMIAQETALRHPERVHRLVLGCTHAGGPRAVLAGPEVMRVLASPFRSREARLAAIVPFIYAANTPPERIERDIEVLRQNPPTNLGHLQQLVAILTWQSYTRLPRLTARTLVIHGEEDRLVPPENAHILARRIPDAKLVLLAGASHIFPTDQPERTEEELLSFLAMPD